jgi:hypothetical protein
METCMVVAQAVRQRISADDLLIQGSSRGKPLNGVGLAAA